MTTTIKTATITKEDLPEILTANTYYWRGSGCARSRRSNEDRRHEQVRDFFSQFDFLQVSSSGDYTYITDIQTGGNMLDVTFEYSESCKNVYKRLAVNVNGKKSNVIGLVKIINKLGGF